MLFVGHLGIAGVGFNFECHQSGTDQMAVFTVWSAISLGVKWLSCSFRSMEALNLEIDSSIGVTISDLAIFIAFRKRGITFKLILTLTYYYLHALGFQMNFVRESDKQFRRQYTSNFPRENSRTKRMGVGAYGKRHCERGTAYSAIAYWFLAIVNDQMTNTFFLGSS